MMMTRCVSWIITKGGEVVNSVPDDVEMELTVRARNIEALKDDNEKVNRAIKGAAITIGGTAVIEDTPGQMPLCYNKAFAKHMRKMPKHVL